MRPSVIDVAVDAKLPYFKKSFATLLEQTNNDFEFLIVVGYPGDETRAFLATQAPPFEMIIIQEPLREAYPARASANNMGLDAATGSVYIGTQDDVLYPPNWIESHIQRHARDDGPWYVLNRVQGALTSGELDEEDKFWGRISNPRHLPIHSRWRYGSGHSFSLPMSVAKTLRHDERYNSCWGFEDCDFAYQAHLAGCKFVFNLDTRVVHQNHGDRAVERRQKSKGDFMQWLKERSHNRWVFMDKWGFCPEYGTPYEPQYMLSSKE